MAGSPKLPWSRLPTRVRDAVQTHLGSPVVTAVAQDGGFSAGLAARVRCADGTRAFVKAVGLSVNDHTPAMHRREALIAAALPDDVPTPRLRFGYDDGDWVALVFDESSGRTPVSPWDVDDAVRVAGAVLALTATLTPCPLPAVVDAVVLLADDLISWSRLAAVPPPDLDPWELRHLDRLAALGEAAADPAGPMAGDTLLHLDLRSDNVLLEPGGPVVFVDWPWAARGAAWLDPVTFALDPMTHGGHDPEQVLERAGWTDPDPDGVTALLLALAGMWAESSRQPAPAGMPTVRRHQRRFHDTALAWGRRRCGWA
ncbi:MAG: phosphotransferase [Geodermatophilaceae bacterium]|nr:phosphotransferase [Geodermatophilaceae bacterium]